MNYDNNKIGLVISISLILKTFKLVIIIANISFFFGMFWLLFCRMEDYFYYYKKSLEENYVMEDNFMYTFNVVD